jgi:hypothetical protein
MDDLNRSTNRLRRKFDPTSNYLETQVQMEQVMDSARRVNQVMTKGNYGTQAQHYNASVMIVFRPSLSKTENPPRVSSRLKIWRETGRHLQKMAA